jgi:hypothetical protein
MSKRLLALSTLALLIAVASDGARAQFYASSTSSRDN